MARSAHQKLKILYLSRMLLEKTDEDHRLTVNEMIQELNRWGIEAERKTIYSDLEALRSVSATAETTAEEASSAEE